MVKCKTFLSSSRLKEEADSRIFLHIHDANGRYGTEEAIIWSPDTDVLGLGTYSAQKFGIKMWFTTGVRLTTWDISIHDIAEKLGPTMCS